METTPHGLSPEWAATQALVIFSVGGRRLAARADEMAGVRLWGRDVPIPSRTPYVHGLMRQGNEVLPVYDLGARLNLKPEGSPALCLVAKHQKGMLAVAIDGELPTLRPFAALSIAMGNSNEPDVLGTCQLGSETIPVFSLATLGNSDESQKS